MERHYMKLEINNLSKRYPNGTRAIDDVTLSIEHGMFGLLGPNGAGKTTLMRILVTLMKPTEGQATIDGLDIFRNRGKIREMLGYLPQEFSTFPKLRTWEFLDYSARLSGIVRGGDRKRRVDDMLEKVGLYEARDRFASKLSGGMQRRLGIAQALIGNPRVLVVDEPTTGLDPEERLRFRNILSDLVRQDIIIILSTHIVGDISSTCTRMAMLNQGRVVYDGSPSDLIDRTRGKVWRITATSAELDDLNLKYPVITTIPDQDGWSVEVVADDIGDYTGEQIDPTLEHAYVHYIEGVTGEREVLRGK